MSIVRTGGGSEKITIDGKKAKERLDLISTKIVNKLTDFPVRESVNSGRIFDDGESIYIGYRSNGVYKYNNGSWTKIASSLTLNGSYCFFNNEIHFLGQQGSQYQAYHYVLRNGKWVELNYVPDAGGSTDGYTLVFKNELYTFTTQGNIMKSSDGQSWTNIPTAPNYSTTFSNGHFCAFVHDDTLRMLGGTYYQNDGSYIQESHRVFNGTTWSTVNTLPYRGVQMSGVSYDGSIHLMGGYNGNLERYHYLLNDDGSVKEKRDELPFAFYQTKAFAIKNRLFMAGGTLPSGLSGGALSYSIYEIDRKAFIIKDKEII